MPVWLSDKPDDVGAEAQTQALLPGQHQRAAKPEGLDAAAGAHVEGLAGAGNGPGAREVALLRRGAAAEAAGVGGTGGLQAATPSSIAAALAHKPRTAAR